MKKKIAINGFGRIGRLTLRAFFNKKVDDIEILAINDLGNVESNIHYINMIRFMENAKRLSNRIQKL